MDIIKNVNNKEFISDIIDIKDIQSWSANKIVIINSGTGSGKSYFILNKLGRFCLGSDKKILFLTNRILLKDQMKSNIDKCLDNTIDIVSYQKLTKDIVNNKFAFDKYNYIVSDECHYFFTDSKFNNLTDIPLETILLLKKQIRIFLSATSNIFEKFINDRHKDYGLNLPIVYKVKNKFYYNKLYHYKNFDNVINYLKNIPNNEKVIYFSNSIKKAYDMHKIFIKESAFICSDYSNNIYKKYSNDKVKLEIEKNNKFNCKILFTTQMLDNGINIIDRELKHIFININDFDIVQQCIGRKRFIDRDDKVNIYIQRLSKKGIKGSLNSFMKPLSKLKDFNNMSNKEFVEKYGRLNVDGLIYEIPNSDKGNGAKHKVNVALKYKLENELSEYLEMNSIKSAFPNIDLITKRYGLKSYNVKSLEKELDKVGLGKEIEKFLNKKMFEKDKEKFIKYLKENFSKTNNKNKTLGIKTINEYFKSINSNYTIKSIRETERGKNCYKYYWLLYDKSLLEIKNDMEREREEYLDYEQNVGEGEF